MTKDGIRHIGTRDGRTSKGTIGRIGMISIGLAKDWAGLAAGKDGTRHTMTHRMDRVVVAHAFQLHR